MKLISINKIVLILTLIVIFCLILGNILSNNSNLSNFTTCPILNIYRVKTSRSSSFYDKVLVIGGVHGNEPAPAYAIEDFYKKKKDNIVGNVTFIPRVNSEGIKKNTRYLPCKSSIFISYDINRHFKYNQKVNKFQKNLIKLIENHDFVLDFHEAYDFNKINNSSVGSASVTCQ